MRRSRLPSLTSVRNFEAVARHKSFTKAADELCVTQGAVSHQIKILEEELRARLLIRGRLGVELTPLGSKLLDVCSNAFDDLAIVVGEIREEAAITRQRLRLHVSAQFGQFWLAPRITRFSAENPDIEVHISATRPVKADDQALMIVAGSDEQSSASGDRLFSSNLLPLCSPSLLGTRKKPGENMLLQQTNLLCESGHDWWLDWNAIVGEQRDLPHKRVYFDDAAAMVHVAACGGGVLMGSRQLLRDYIDRNQLIAPLNPSLHVSRAYHLSYDSKAISSCPAQAFRSWLLNEIKLDTRLQQM